MSVDTEIQPPETQPENSAPILQGAEPLADALGDPLSDPLAEGGDEAVQMVLPPKPGAGPKVGDPTQSVEQILAEDTNTELSS